MPVAPACPPPSTFLTNPLPPHFPASNTSRPTMSSCLRAPPPPRPTPPESSTVVPPSLPTKCPPHTHQQFHPPRTLCCRRPKMFHSCRSTPAERKRVRAAIQYIPKQCPGLREGKDRPQPVKEDDCLQTKLLLSLSKPDLSLSNN